MKHIRYILILVCLLPLSARPSDSISTSHSLIQTQWYSHAEHLYRFVDIYVPNCYSVLQNDTTSDGFMPVLYLLHGLGGYEHSWEEMADAIDTLDAMIASGRCKPMIVVMPDCGRWPVTSRPSAHNSTIWKCMFRYAGLIHEHEVEEAMSDLMDMIDSTYCVSWCAIAGMSDGARMAINAANKRPDRIRDVALFSSVWHNDQRPVDSTQNYSVYAGKKDFFYGHSQRFGRWMNRHNRTYQWIEFEESHDWDMWRLCLSHYLESLSKK